MKIRLFCLTVWTQEHQKKDCSLSYLSDFSQIRRCFATAPTGADESCQKANVQRIKVSLWLHKSKERLLFVCHMLISTENEINDDRYKHDLLLFVFEIKYKNTSREWITHKHLCLLDTSVREYIFWSDVETENSIILLWGI